MISNGNPALNDTMTIFSMDILGIDTNFTYFINSTNCDNLFRPDNFYLHGQ
ncbi:MAG: hypothetical protein H7Y00_13980 [Fimbriimonadaceae bacterium]|nr:hypothetical protein [Chitinophagales bacterium]